MTKHTIPSTSLCFTSQQGCIILHDLHRVGNLVQTPKTLIIVQQIFAELSDCCNTYMDINHDRNRGTRQLLSLLLLLNLHVKKQELNSIIITLMPLLLTVRHVPLFQLFNLTYDYTEGRTPWTGDQPITSFPSTHKTTQTEQKHTRESMCRAVFETRSQNSSRWRQFKPKARMRLTNLADDRAKVKLLIGTKNEVVFFKVSIILKICTPKLTRIFIKMEVSLCE